jgi:hypothetical protein
MNADYITGILEKNEVLEAYHSVPFRRQLMLRTLSGKVLTIDDPATLSNDLKSGRTYHMIVLAEGVESIRAFTTSKTLSADFSGVIRELEWFPEIGHYLAFDEGVLSQPLAVIGTAFGNILFPHGLIVEGLAVGNALTWGKDQFRLVAVYR